MQCSFSGGFIMAADKKADLRIQRTKDSIRKTFEEMICEMDYEQISIKELAQNFIKRTQGMERPRDMDKITREFFLCSEELGKTERHHLLKTPISRTLS